MNGMELIEFGRRVERLETAARKVIGDWHASQQTAGKIIHICSEREFSEGECACEADAPAVQWASLALLEQALGLPLIADAVGQTTENPT